MNIASSENDNMSTAPSVCPFCDKPIPENAKFCPECGARINAYQENDGNSGKVTPEMDSSSEKGHPPYKVVDSSKSAPNPVEIAEVAKSVERLAHPLSFVGLSDALDPMGCLFYSILGIIFFLLNPIRYFVSFGYYCSADSCLKEGNIEKAKELVSQCHKVNVALFFLFGVIWFIVLKIYGVI